MIALKLTLSKNEFRKLVKSIDIALKNLASRMTVLDIETVLESMGFPTNWKNNLLQ